MSTSSTHNTERQSTLDEYKIEDGVQIPRRNKHKALVQALLKLQPGQSFLIPGKRPAALQGNLTYAKAKTPGSEFSTRTVEGGTRVWRTQ